MITLSSNPFELKASPILYLIHPKDVKDPEVLRTMQMIIGQPSQIAKVGETIMTEARFKEFKVVVVCPSPSNQKDFLHRLTKSEWKERLQRISQDKQKLLIVIGNSVQLTAQKVLIIPKGQSMFLNDSARSHNFDVDTAGLGVTRYRYDINYTPDQTNEYYQRILFRLSSQEPIFLMDPSVTVSNDGRVQFGALYKVEKGKINLTKALPEDLSLKSQEQVQQRNVIAPIRAINEDQQQDVNELQAAYAATSQPVTIIGGRK